MTPDTQRAPAFDTDRPWGAFAPAPSHARLLGLSHRLPESVPALRRLVPALRRPMKYGVDHALDVVVWGLRLRLSPRGNKAEGRLLFAPQYFDPEERAFIAEHLRPGGTFVDAGANVGAYTFWAHRCLQGRGRILAIEPDPEMHRRLQFNLHTNGLSEVVAAAVALSDQAGTGELYVKPSQRGSNSLVPPEGDTDPRVVQKVPLQPLDELLAAHGVTAVDVLKIDIEGLEPRVLKHFFAHAPQSLWPRVVVIEYRPETAPDLDPLFAAAGYRRQFETRLNRGFVR